MLFQMVPLFRNRLKDRNMLGKNHQQHDRRPPCRYLWQLRADSPILSGYKVLMSTKPGVSDCKQARQDHGEGFRPGETLEERRRRITDGRRRCANNSTFTPRACRLCETQSAIVLGPA